MACGTGKTFTSLKIAEEIGGIILFLTPSFWGISFKVKFDDMQEHFEVYVPFSGITTALNFLSGLKYW
jgi:predicted helicase